MAMRNVLLVATAFIVVMAMVFIFYGDTTNSSMSASHKNGASLSIGEASTSIDDARKAFWDRDLVEAERLYLILTTYDDANVDTWGELGNIYYQQAKWKDAANAYAEVALRLIDKKDMQQAAFFHHMVSQMDPEQSARINEHLRSLNTNAEHN